MTQEASDTIRQQIARTEDEIRLLQDAVNRDGVTIHGSRGLVVAHPALAALARHRKVLADLMRAAGDLPSLSTTEIAKRAAKARWARTSAATAPKERDPVFVPKFCEDPTCSPGVQHSH
jgi:hypothetical protein